MGTLLLHLPLLPPVADHFLSTTNAVHMQRVSGRRPSLQLLTGHGQIQAVNAMKSEWPEEAPPAGETPSTSAEEHSLFT